MEDINGIHSREIVYPGQIISTDPNKIPGRGAIRENGKILSIFIGIKEERGKYINVVPLKGQLYIPSVGDKIIGKVIEKTPVKWIIDINSNTVGYLKPSDVIDRNMILKRNRKRSKREEEIDTMKLFNIGDILIVKVFSGDRLSTPLLTTIGEGLGKLNDGIVIQIEVPKIPRIIGKKGSMINILKKYTNCKMFIAKNGRIWLKGRTFEHEQLLIDAIYKIEKEAHTFKLTDRIEYFLKEEKKKRGLK
ncbi:MAG: exosome complex RNA-binding protein Rrp4 [Promethearchaeota archaeon]